MESKMGSPIASIVGQFSFKSVASSSAAIACVVSPAPNIVKARVDAANHGLGCLLSIDRRRVMAVSVSPAAART